MCMSDIEGTFPQVLADTEGTNEELQFDVTVSFYYLSGKNFRKKRERLPHVFNVDCCFVHFL